MCRQDGYVHHYQQLPNTLRNNRTRGNVHVMECLYFHLFVLRAFAATRVLPQGLPSPALITLLHVPVYVTTALFYLSLPHCSYMSTVESAVFESNKEMPFLIFVIRSTSLVLCQRARCVLRSRLATFDQLSSKPDLRCGSTHTSLTVTLAQRAILWGGGCWFTRVRGDTAIHCMRACPPGRLLRSFAEALVVVSRLVCFTDLRCSLSTSC